VHVANVRTEILKKFHSEILQGRELGRLVCRCENNVKIGIKGAEI
jgi:hypothetical protein